MPPSKTATPTAGPAGDESRQALQDACDTIRLFGEPTRLIMLRAIAAGEGTVAAMGELCSPITQSALSVHLGRLAAAGVIGRRRDGKRNLYHLTRRGAALMPPIEALIRIVGGRIETTPRED